MEVVIYWTDFAKQELQEIFDYYIENASLRVAQNLVEGIIEESLRLVKQPEIGQEEDLLTDFDYAYRYLIYKNYKIIYMIDFNRNVVEIHDVFDTRQNPIKIIRKK